MTLVVDIAEEYEYETDDLLSDGEIALFVITKDDISEITSDLSAILTDCYIDADHLQQLADMNELSLEEQLEEILPDSNTMKSGDFGEIFSRQFLQEYEGGSFPVYRWRNRSSRNDTVRGTDLIGYINVGDEPHRDDCLILCEAKSRARSVKKQVVLDAFNGVKNDYASRMANSLIFSQARLLQDGDTENAKKLARFRNPHKNPYRKKLIASVVHRDSTWKDEFLDYLPEEHGMDAELKVVVFKIEDLHDFIDEIYSLAIEKAE